MAANVTPEKDIRNITEPIDDMANPARRDINSTRRNVGCVSLAGTTLGMNGNSTVQTRRAFRILLRVSDLVSNGGTGSEVLVGLSKPL